jgi:hypothetical protein
MIRKAVASSSPLKILEKDAIYKIFKPNTPIFHYSKYERGEL